ncbi:DUF1501 domain-containing protein [Dactylosporangium aurantiacum]|uniref:DUF1501 domain-containing protein n=1 Tax=Dactylosporangium aurantiacum TaxID=35754 RepID=A0A9Q9ILW6_9ACTN|nr:DUF1501 domain-containing protein [Dactylosporangium aurantiacum]MDG6100572.1 DUF1501 domain-containing protein [Dactylosporangium aurantiacum]UWZ55335.1 DUF1501 domain-containing protein [Dactylosporangium aurantiacum]
MDTVTRRRFLIASGVAGGAALAAGGAWTLRDVLATATWDDRPGDAKTLVLVTLYGGNDGLANVIPFAERGYRDARNELAYDAEEVLRLDDTLGLNPALTGFKRMYDAKKLAVVRGVGYPKPDHSHFRSMDIWQTAQPDRPGNTGWLGRWLDTYGGDPRHAISFEAVLPPLLAGATSAGAAVPVTGLALPNGVRTETLKGFGAAAAGEPPLQARAARAFADLVSVDALVDGVDSDGDDDTEGGGGTGTGGRSDLRAQLDLVARCVEANVATRVFSVSLGGFDLHADERDSQEQLLRRLDEALTGFAERMAKTEAGRKVVVAVYSEFGRRVAANGSDGTDHGTASNMFLLGSPVTGGLYGEQPSLSDLDNGDLKFTTDFRSVYATLLRDVLDADPQRILGYDKTLSGLLR